MIYQKSSDGEEYWYEYDERGNKIHVMKTGGNDYRYKYDDKGQCIYENKNGQITTYEYKTQEESFLHFFIYIFSTVNAPSRLVSLRNFLQARQST